MPEIKDRPFNNLEIKRLNEAAAAVNVEALLPPDWQRQIAEALKNDGKLVEFEGGKVSTSLELSSFTTVYTVVEGEDIQKRLPWLVDLWQGPFRETVSSVAGQEVVPDRDTRFGVNINQIDLDTQRNGYELHTDINPWTGMLAVTDIHRGDGGELVHVLPDGRRVETRIKAGMLYIFDGRNHPHKVNLLSSEGSAHTRITLPMDYVFPGWDPKRPADMKAIFGNGNGNGNGNNRVWYKTRYGLSQLHKIF